jgi:hypothetical protein
MRLALHTFIGFGVALVCLGPAGGAAPDSQSDRSVWKLDFAFEDPARISITLPGDVEPTTYWYMLYTVTNSTERDIAFFPTFDLVTETLDVVKGGDAVSPRVVGAIRALHRKRYPFLVDPMKVSGPLRQGVDNARTSVAVFRNFDPDANRFTVFVAGLSGEIERVPNPTFDRDKPVSDSNSPFFLFRKTLAIEYDLPGDQRTRREAVPQRTNQEWVMR